MEPGDVVVRFAVQFEPCTHRRTLRCGIGGGARQLACHHLGAAKRFNAIKWSVVKQMVWAWLLTIPITGLIAYGLVRLIRALGS